MAEQKQYLLLVSTNIEFKKPLKAEDKFYVTCKLVTHENNSTRFAFAQEIRKMDETLISKSHNVGVCINGNNKIGLIYQRF